MQKLHETKHGKSCCVEDTQMLATSPHTSPTPIMLPLRWQWYGHFLSRRQCPHGPGTFLCLLKMGIPYCGSALPSQQGEKNQSVFKKGKVYAKYMWLESYILKNTLLTWVWGSVALQPATHLLSPRSKQHRSQAAHLGHWRYLAENESISWFQLTPGFTCEVAQY